MRLKRSLRGVIIAVAVCLITPMTNAQAGRWVTGDRHGDRIEGSGRIVSRSLDLRDFDSIRLDGVFTVEIEVGPDYSVELEAEDNLIDLVMVEVRRGQLRLDIEDHYEIETDEEFRLTITMPRLVEIEGDGVYELWATGLDNDLTTIRVDGVGEIELEGRTEKLEVECSGVGEIDLRNLVAQIADVSVDGVGEVYVHVEDDLRAQVDGMGQIRYRGDPRSVDDEVDGFGSIRGSR
jgi:hypothetical protein